MLCTADWIWDLGVVLFVCFGQLGSRAKVIDQEFRTVEMEGMLAGTWAWVVGVLYCWAYWVGCCWAAEGGRSMYIV